jgi:hypothetical protein
MSVQRDLALLTPGMEEVMKITLRISSRDVLMLTQLIGRGLNDAAIRKDFPDTSIEVLKSLESTLLEQCKFSSEFIQLWKESTSGTSSR